MLVQLHPGNDTTAREPLAERAEQIVEDAVGRFADQITRVEIYMSDGNADKGGANDKRCAMEARLAGHQPITVTHHGATVREALAGAAAKLERTLEHTLGKLGDRRAS